MGLREKLKFQSKFPAILPLFPWGGENIFTVFKVDKVFRLIRLLIVACGMLSHSSSMAVWSCWILAGTGTHCCTRQSRASQTCSMGDKSGEYAAYGRPGTFSASRNCVQVLATWGHVLSCWSMRWWWGMTGTIMGLMRGWRGHTWSAVVNPVGLW